MKLHFKTIMLPEAPWNSEGIHSFTYLIKKKKNNKNQHPFFKDWQGWRAQLQGPPMKLLGMKNNFLCLNQIFPPNKS